MNIWIVSAAFKPEGNAPATRLGGFAKLWAAQGHTVDVLTSLPGQDKGKIHEGYATKKADGSNRTETIDGATVHRHKHYITPKKGAVPRLLQQLAFMFAVLFGNVFSARPLKNNPNAKPDVILASSPDFFPTFAAWLLAVRYKADFVLEVRDLWPGIFKEMGVLTNKPLLWLLERFELCIYKKAKAIVVVTHGFKADLVARGVPAEKVFVITNGLPDADFEKAQNPAIDAAARTVREQLGLSPETKLIAYIGNHGQAQALGQVIDAARLLHKRTDIQFLMVGAGAEKALIEDMAQLAPNVRCLPNQPKEQILAFYKAADVNLVTHKNIKVFDVTIPSKLFECLAVGKPTLGCLGGEAAKILTDAGQVCVPREEPEKLAAALLKLVAETPENAKARAEAGTQAVQKYLHSALVDNYKAVFAFLDNSDK